MGLLERVNSGATRVLCRHKMGRNLRTCLRIHQSMGFLDPEHRRLAELAPRALVALTEELDSAQQNAPQLFASVAENPPPPGDLKDTQ